MSLLMDALKKAERAKQQGASTDSAPQAPALDLEPMETPAAAPPPGESAPATPELPRKIETLDEEFIAHARQAAPSPARTRPDEPQRKPAPMAPRKPPADTAGREAVRNAFAVKQPAGGSSRSFGLVVGAISLAAVTVIAVYFWLQLKPVPRLTPQGQAAPVAPTAPIAPPIAPPAAQAPEPPPAPAAPPAAEVPTGRATAPTVPPKPAAAAAVPRSPAVTAPPEPAVRISRARPQVAPALANAYEAFQAGDLAAAAAGYAQVLQGDPRNLDALQGAAAVALRQGRPQDAEAYYLRVVDVDPRDAQAQAGLVGLHRQGDPVASESRLKTLLAAQPEVPVLHFALGNVYARQSRWSEAQQAYFKAMTGDADNPDYLFNLAVSLDQLHQDGPAAQYYRQALAAAAARPAAFDPARAAARLQDLQSTGAAAKP